VREVIWGKDKQHRIWLMPNKRKRFLWKNHDALYIALGHLRLRIMKKGKRYETQ
jgi:hypothetical protein